MSRTPRIERKMEEVTRTEFDRTCDRCGVDLTEPDGLMAPTERQEIIVILNDGECVSPGFRRDYCQTCAFGQIVVGASDWSGGIWDELCKIIRADPGADSRDWHED